MNFIKLTLFSIVVFAVQAMCCGPAWPAEQEDKLERILKGIEARYAPSGFSARFDQISHIKDMDIKDTASGTILVKRPGMMIWTYEKPEKQMIVTDGNKLWLYRPEERQVMVGDAPYFFGDGKGAGFLTDVKQIKTRFNISLNNNAKGAEYALKLLPLKKHIDISKIVLSVSKDTFDIKEIVTFNAYGDETRIRLSKFQFLENLDSTMFRFVIPKDVDVLQLQEEN